MKRMLLFLVFVLCGSIVNAQCWKHVDFYSGIKTDGTMWVWGVNNHGQYGNGTTTSSSIPVKVGNDTWTTMSCSNVGTVYGIKTNGSLWAWGANHFGESGLGSTPTSVLNPIQIGTDTNWKSISSNYYHSLAIKTDGTLWAWGMNDAGAVGDGTTILRSTPIQIGTATDWKAVCAGQGFSMAIKTNGTLWSWGSNVWGQLGNGTNIDSLVPSQVGIDTNWISIFANNGSSSAAYALKSNGTIWAWGQNTYYELGDGSLVSKNIPTQIGTDNDWTAIGERMAVKNNGTLWGWGQNSGGMLGDGTTTNRPTPSQIGTDIDWVTPSCITLFKLKTDGTLWASGSTLNLGTGGINSTLIPVQIPTTNCPTIIANDDSGSIISGFSNTPVYNVLANDTFNGNPATLSSVTLSFLSATHSGITLNTATGAVNVAATVPVGTYTLVYQICQTTSLTNCDTASVTITVNPQTVDAVNDNFASTSINYLTGDYTPSVLSNDTVNGAATNPANVILTLTNNGGITGATINPDGTIWIPAATLINTYTLQYSICLVSSPTICDTATVTVSVADPVTTTPEIVFAIRANKTVYQSELQSTGKIIIGGIFNKYNNVNAKHLIRLNIDLTQDTSFPSLGTLPDPPYDFKVLSNDKIIVVGTFTSVNGTPTGKGIARLNADGTVDTSFNVGGTGIGINDRVLACAIQSDGKILLGGGFIRSYNGVPVRNMIRLNANGSLDTSFVYPYTYEQATFGSVHTINVAADGKIIVSGNSSSTLEGQTHLFQLNTDGSLDVNFATGTVGQDYYRNPAYCSTCVAPIQNVVLQPDGKILVVGAFNSYLKYTRKNIVRLFSTGSVDLAFTTTLSDRVINDVVLEPDGKLIIGGEFTTLAGFAHAKLGRLNTNGTRDASFSSGNGPTHTAIPAPMPTVMNLNRQSDGKVIVSGMFSHYNSISATNITRITPEIPGGQARGRIQLWNAEPEIENSLPLADGIRIYPNPSTGIFTVDLIQSKGQFTTITVYNTLGQKVYQKNNISEAVNEIDLSGLPIGSYYARITGSAGSIQKILMKK